MVDDTFDTFSREWIVGIIRANFVKLKWFLSVHEMRDLEKNLCVCVCRGGGVVL